MFVLRVLAATAGFLLSGAYGLTIVVARRDRSRVAVDYARLLARLTQPALGLRLRVLGAAHLDGYRPCVFIANIRPGTVEVRVLEPIGVEEYGEDDVDLLVERAWSAMAATLREMAGDVRPTDLDRAAADDR